MGWTSFAHRGRKTIDILREEFEQTPTLDRRGLKILDHSIGSGAAYLLIESTPRDGGELGDDYTYVQDADGRLRFIAIVLVRRGKREFAYKDMTEGMGPYKWGCPQRLIDRASRVRQPTPEELAKEFGGSRVNALKWREGCRTAREAKQKKAKLAIGTAIKLSRPVKFSDGYEGDSFTVASYSSKGKSRRAYRALHGGLYRISNIDGIGYEVVA